MTFRFCYHFSLCIALAVGLISCTAQKRTYPAAYVQNFMNGCIYSGGTQIICSCIIDKIQERYSLEEFSQIEVKMQATGVLPEEILDFVGTCRTRS